MVFLFFADAKQVFAIFTFRFRVFEARTLASLLAIPFATHLAIGLLSHTLGIQLLVTILNIANTPCQM